MIEISLLVAFLLNPIGLLVLLVLLLGKPSQRRRYVLFIGILFGLLGYCSVPLRIIDISRYFQQLDSIRSLPFYEAFNWADDGLIVKNLFFWLIAQANDNQLLPFFCLSIVYSVAAYIVCDSVNDDPKVFGPLLIILCMLLPFYNIFSNIRNVTAFALLLLASYRDIYQKKRNLVTLLLYILPCFFHMAGFVVVLIRIVVPLISRLSVLATWLFLGIPVVTIYFYPFLRSIKLPGSIGKIISRAVWKAYASIMRTSKYAQETQTHGSFIVNRLLCILFCTALLFLLKYYLVRHRGENHKQQYAYFVQIITIICIALATLGVVKYWVFMYLLFISSPPIVASSIHIKKNNAFSVDLPIIIIAIVAFCRLALQVRSFYLDLDCAVFFERFFVTNYIQIFIRCIAGLFNVIGSQGLV